jgi:hypothetical protein
MIGKDASGVRPFTKTLLSFLNFLLILSRGLPQGVDHSTMS